MQTIETTHSAEAHATAPRVTVRRRWWEYAVVAVLAAVLGVAAGWAIWGSEDEPTALRAGGGALTDRQEQLVARVEEYRAAWASEDPNDVLDMFVPSGRLVQNFDEYLLTLVFLHRRASILVYTEIRRFAAPGGFVQQHVLVGDGKYGPLRMPAIIRFWVEDNRITRLEEYLDTRQALVLYKA
jgi:hypothetical protein